MSRAIIFYDSYQQQRYNVIIVNFYLQKYCLTFHGYVTYAMGCCINSYMSLFVVPTYVLRLLVRFGTFRFRRGPFTSPVRPRRRALLN